MNLPVLDMQAPEPPTVLDSSQKGSSHYLDRGLVSSANRPGFPAAYTQHCAPAADAALERHAGRAMHTLPLPPPTSLPPAPFGRRQEPVASLAKAHPQFSPARSEQLSYPSPPMSDSHSPAHRSAHLVEPEGPPYPPPVSDARRLEAYPQPPLPLPRFDHRSATSAQAMQHQRPPYASEASSGQSLQYQSGGAIDPSRYSNAPLTQNYAYGYPPPGVQGFLGSQGPGPQGQPTAMIAPPPMRQTKPARRTKAHVASACVNCKKAHLSCDVQRPCGRCVASGKQDSCKDVQHKKRGRPRLRDDKDFSRSEDGRQPPTQLLGALPTSATLPESFPHQPSFPLSHRAADPLRPLQTSSRDGETISSLRPQLHAQPDARQRSVGSYDGSNSSPYMAGANLPYQSLPVAFLNLDLVVLKANQAFRDLVPFLGDLRGKSLMDLLEARSTDILHRMRNELRDEREEREPTYMAPITPIGQDPLQSVPENDVDLVSQGFKDRAFLLNFKLANNQHQSLQCQIRLAKTSLYFVTLVVHTPPRPAGPPLLTQHMPAPTPTRASQTLSAPTTAPSREFASYPVRPLSSAGSAPSSPYFNFASVRTSLPTITSGAYGSSPSYKYSPTSGAEQGYFSTIQPPQPGTYPSPYPPVTRTGSVASEPPIRQEAGHEPSRNARLEGLQLPPIRTTPAPLHNSPRTNEHGEVANWERIRPRESPASAERPETPDTGKRRRLNIREVLE